MRVSEAKQGGGNEREAPGWSCTRVGFTEACHPAFDRCGNLRGGDRHARAARLGAALRGERGRVGRRERGDRTVRYVCRRERETARVLTSLGFDWIQRGARGRYGSRTGAGRDVSFGAFLSPAD